MNILITSAGRRGYIIEYFKEALSGKGKVYAANSNVFSPAFYYADEHVVTPLIYDDEYIPFLLEFCKNNNIKMIISLFDIDLLVLAENKELFAQKGILVVVSSESVIRICNDKWNTYQFCKRNGLSTPQTFLDIDQVEAAVKNGCMRYPVIIKPRWGMGSLAVYQAFDEIEAKVLIANCKRDIQNSYLKYEAAFDLEKCVVIQEKLQGQEYGMDIIHDLDGNFCCNIVRKKYAMRGGETDCAAVEKNQKMNLFAERLGKALGHIGNLDVDLFIVGHKIYLLEMNARLGGGGIRLVI